MAYEKYISHIDCEKWINESKYSLDDDNDDKKHEFLWKNSKNFVY